MSRQPILQQYYTRGRQGIFRSNEGYDTVAKSPGLDNQFIKKTLHPFCVYDAPRQLQERAESNTRLYPEALVCFRAESGEMVLGRSVFVGADFTGQRNTFFSHNYVIPGERRDEFIKEPANVFGLRAFEHSHGDMSGKELPELANLPYQAGLAGDRKQLLRQMEIDERLFKQLLYAVMSSLSAKKKVFISLNGEVGQSSAFAKQLLEILYGCLPYEMRRHFGFLTYSNEPQSKKYIHVMFVEQGSIRLGNGHSDKDFLFDFANQLIHNADLLEEEHEFLNFAWEYLNEPRMLAPFHAFADEVLAGAGSATSLRVTTYYELCALYLIEKGRMSIYERNKPGIWQVLINYLGHEGLVNKKRLHELLTVLFREESNALAAKKLPASEIVRLTIDSYGVAGHDSFQTEIVKYVIDVLLEGKMAGQHGYVAEVYKHLSGNRELFGFMMRTIFGYQQMVKPLFEDYLAQRLAAAFNLDQVLKEIQFWASAVPQALRNPHFISATIQKLLSLFAGERQKPDAVLEIHRFFWKFAGSRSYAEELLDEVDKSLLKQISLDTLSEEDFGKIIDLLEGKPQTFFGGLDVESRQKRELLMHVHSLSGQTGVPLPQEFFRKWDEQDIRVLQRLIRNMLGHSFGPDSFAKAALVFYSPDARVQDSFSFAEMLAFVHKSGGDGVVYPFIQWTMSQRMFFEGKYLAPSYRHALKRYFLEEKGKRLRDKEWRKRWMAIRNADFRKMLEEVRNETANPLLKLFRQKSMMVIGLATVVTAGAVGGFMLLGPKTIPSTPPLPAEGEAGKQGAHSGTADMERPEKAVAVPVYQLMIDPQIQPVTPRQGSRQTN